MLRAQGRLAATLAALAAAGTFAGAGRAAPAPALASTSIPFALRTTTLDAAGLRRLTARRWISGRYATGSGTAVRVSISPAYASDPGAAQRWAEFFASLVHGPELADLDAYIAPLPEVESICHGDAFGCYRANHLVAMGEASHGISAASVATHEYGHHVAFHRLNPPWMALDWGTKRWATAMRVCGRAAAGTAFPGAEDTRYSLNPGEAFAEAYRVMNEMQQGLPLTWPIVDPSFAPDAAALEAIRADVLQPWTGPTVRTIRGRFAPGHRAWTLKLSVPLDGSVSLQLTGAAGDLQLLADDGRTTLARGSWTPAGAKAIQYVDCGRRSLVLRVTRSGAARRFRLNISMP